MTLSKHQSVALGLATGGLLLMGLLLLVRGAPSTARADSGTWFVAPDGAGDCSQAHPCDLPTALSTASEGNAIYLSQGTYTGTGAAVISLTQAVSLYGGWDGVAIGEPRRNPASYVTKLDGEGIRRVAYITGSIAPVLDGLVIANGNADGFGGWNTSDVGGGIYIHSASPLITGCTIVSNSAGSATMTGVGTGGGLFLFESDARLEHSRIISNTARWGGGARVVSGGPTLRHNLFLSNTSLFGGGVYLMWAEGLVEDSLFQGNSADFGGGLYLSGCSATIRGNLIRQNQAGVGGGIGINGGTSPVIVSGNRVLENRANYVGGGVNVQRNDTHLENNFVARNEAPRGGGIHLEKASFVLRHNTLAGNVGAEGGGALVGEDTTVVLTNTILVGHAVGIGVIASSTATLEATLWYDNGSDTGGAGAIYTGAVNIWGDPTFVDPAGWNYHLLEGSPAVDAGVDAGTMSDIDGDKRPRGPGYDIGADEYPAPYLIYLPLVRR